MSWCGNVGGWPGSGCTGPESANPARSPRSSTCTRWRSRTRSGPTSGPKLERYGDTLFVVLRAARYLDDAEEVEFGELHVFVGPDFVITVRHGEVTDLARGAAPAGGRPRAAAPGPGGGAVRHPRRGRRRLRAGRRRAGRTTSTRSRPRSSAATPRCRGGSTSCRREVIEFQRATRPLVGMLDGVDGRVRQVRRRRGAAALPARRRRPRHPA